VHHVSKLAPLHLQIRAQRCVSIVKCVNGQAGMVSIIGRKLLTPLTKADWQRNNDKLWAMSTPSLTELRDDIARLCDDVSSGRVAIQAVFDAVDDESAPLCNNYVYVVKLIERLPNVGKVKARRILSDMALTERSHLSDLSPGQRSLIIEQVTQS
jgi:hypothetical protein